MPQTPCGITPKNWVREVLAACSDARATATFSAAPPSPPPPPSVTTAGARITTGIERPETRPRSVGVGADTAAHETRSAKNCGVTVSPKSQAAGTPIWLSWSSSSRACFEPRLI